MLRFKKIGFLLLFTLLIAAFSYESKIIGEKDNSNKSLLDVQVVAGNSLSIKEVEKVSGLTGIKIVPYNPKKGAGGELNFANAEDKLILMVNFGRAKIYDRSKKLANYYKADVPDVGQEAFKGPKNDPQYFLMFRKNDRTITLTTYLNLLGGKKSPTMLTMQQLIDLGKIIAGKM